MRGVPGVIACGHTRRKHYAHGLCRLCYQAQPHIRADRYKRAKETYQADPDRARDYRYQSVYGITLEQYDAILETQGGVCYICGAPPGKMRLHVDHDHVKMVVRGLLCWSCNGHLIGRRRDPTVFERAAEYLRNPPARSVLPATHSVPKKKRKRRVKA